MCVLPLCTPIVIPTICGKIVEARDQVLITRRSPLRIIARTFFLSDSCIYGPFFLERDIGYLLLPALRRRTIKRSVRLFLRVLYPRAGLPQGVCGWPPMGARPSPPPWGWSRGFMTEPRTLGRRPRCRERPALPRLRFS